jgi:hypothetical protein
MPPPPRVTLSKQRNRIMQHPIIRHPRKDFSGIIAAIESAQRSGLKRVSLRLPECIIKPSKHQGVVYVFSHDKALNDWGSLSPIYIGHLKANSTNLRDPGLVAALERVAKDPAAAARLYGQETGQCSCCGLPLTRKTSIERGIGPICAERFGL